MTHANRDNGLDFTVCFNTKVDYIYFWLYVEVGVAVSHTTNDTIGFKGQKDDTLDTKTQAVNAKCANTFIKFYCYYLCLIFY